MSLGHKLKSNTVTRSQVMLVFAGFLGILAIEFLVSYLFPELSKELFYVITALAGSLILYGGTLQLFKRFKIANQQKIAEIYSLSEKSISENQDFYQKIINTNPNLIYVKSSNGYYKLINQAFAKFYGTTPQEIIGKLDKTIIQDKCEFENVQKTDLLTLANMELNEIREEILTDHSGEKHWFSTIKSPITTPQNQELHILGVSTDITKLKRCSEKLSFERLHDPLTGLPNQVLLADCLEQVVQDKKIKNNDLFAVMLLDIDHFKRINDGLGYLTGDQLLVSTAERLCSCIRSSDTIARLKGDEFAILLQDLNEISEVYQVVDRVFEKLSQPFHVNGNEVQLSASIGIVFGNECNCAENDMLLDADIAMGQAKLLGKARYVVFNEAMRTHKKGKLKMETELRHALRKKQLQVFYQPIAELSTGKVIGLEALLRWLHPEKGMIYPTEFIPLAEETELIIPIGLWVLREACLQTKSWQENYSWDNPLTISVNISSTQLLDKEFVREAAIILKETGLNPHHLKLEITESIYLENSPEVIHVLNQLNALGIQLFIDDFGTGYSSLSYLRKLPFDAIKIDRSFINGVAKRDGETKIVKAIIRLARDLGKELIAEGVETVEQRCRLQDMGCDYEQGFLFSRPVEAIEVEKFFKNKEELTGL